MAKSCPAQDTLLQCGHAEFSVENQCPCRCCCLDQKLQCGHAEFSVENASPSSLTIWDRRASMRPRRIQRGEPTPLVGVRQFKPALQCGHAEFSVENPSGLLLCKLPNDSF